MKTRRKKLRHPDELGSLIQLADYMGIGRTWLQALKKCAARRASISAFGSNPSPFVGNKATSARIMAWLDRNPDFQPSKEYPRKQLQLQP